MLTQLEELFFKYVREGDAEFPSILDLLISKDININVRNIHGKTPLHIAAFAGHIEIVRLLIDNGADVNACSLHGYTPLHIAVEEDNIEIVKVLLESKADVNAKSNSEDTPLHNAAEKGHTEIVKLLIANGADNNLIDRRSLTPLHKAVKYGNLEIVKILLEKNAEINVKSNDGSTPLAIAACNGYKEITELLLKKGADVNLINDLSETPLHIAFMGGHTDIVKTLLDNGADVNTRNNCGNKPLHMAASQGHTDIVKILLDKGADISAANDDSETPIYIATLGNGQKIEIVETLLENGADINIKYRDLNAIFSGFHMPRPKETIKTFLERAAEMPTLSASEKSLIIEKISMINKAELIDALYNCDKEKFDKIIETFSSYSKIEDIFILPRLEYFLRDKGMPKNFHEFINSLNLPETIKSDLKSYKISAAEDVYSAIEEDILCLFNSFGTTIEMEEKEEKVGFMRLSDIYDTVSNTLYTDEKKQTLKTFYENIPDNIYTIEGFFIGLINNDKEVVELLRHDPYIAQNIFNKLDKLIFDEDIKEGINKTRKILEEDLGKTLKELCIDTSKSSSKEEAIDVNNNNNNNSNNNLHTDKLSKKEDFISR